MIKLFIENAEVHNKHVVIEDHMVVSVEDRELNPVGNAAQTENVVELNGVKLQKGLVQIKGLTANIELPDDVDFPPVLMKDAVTEVAPVEPAATAEETTETGAVVPDETHAEGETTP